MASFCSRLLEPEAQVAVNPDCSCLVPAIVANTNSIAKCCHQRAFCGLARCAVLCWPVAVLVSQLAVGPISIHGQMQQLHATTSASSSQGTATNSIFVHTRVHAVQYSCEQGLHSLGRPLQVSGLPQVGFCIGLMHVPQSRQWFAFVGCMQKHSRSSHTPHAHRQCQELTFVIARPSGVSRVINADSINLQQQHVGFGGRGLYLRHPIPLRCKHCSRLQCTNCQQI